ncbi:MAG: DUF4190 domain-containing protein [Microthrixaceae bacterium]
MPPPQQFGPPPGQGQGTNGLAVASLVLGILSFFCVGLITGPIAVILGFVGRNKANKELNGNGAGMALAGIITGGIAFILSLVFLFVVVLGSNEVINDLEIDTDPSNGVCDPNRFLQDPDC